MDKFLKLNQKKKLEGNFQKIENKKFNKIKFNLHRMYKNYKIRSLKIKFYQIKIVKD